MVLAPGRGPLRGPATIVAMDLPVDDDSAGLSDYADVVVEAIGVRDDLVVVAQSLGGYSHRSSATGYR